jgi:hypothetical protein
MLEAYCPGMFAQETHLYLLFQQAAVQVICLHGGLHVLGLPVMLLLPLHAPQTAASRQQASWHVTWLSWSTNYFNGQEQKPVILYTVLFKLDV